MKKKMLLTLVAAALGSVFMVGTAFAAVDLKLNPDTLRKIRDNTFYTDNKFPTAEDYFVGIGNSEFTLSDVENCLRKYGEEVVSDSSESGEGFSLLLDKNGFFIGTPEIGSAELASFEIAAKTSLMSDEEYLKGYYDIIYRKPLYKDTEFWTECWFDNAAFDAFIERVEIINNGGGMEGWKFEDGAWRYYVNNTAVTGWQQIDGVWYYFKEDTSMVHSGFYRVDGIIYHFAESGAMDTGWQFLTREDGVTCWYYFNDDGSMCIGWKMIDGLWYYFQNDGTMTHSCIQEINGGVYSFSTSGWIDFGWQIRNPGDGDHWYYFEEPDGFATIGYVQGINGDHNYYFFWDNGYTDQNGQGHSLASLAMGSGQEYEIICKNGEIKYFADSNGHLLTNTSVYYNGKTYSFDAQGNYIPEKTKLDEVKEMLNGGNDTSKLLAIIKAHFNFIGTDLSKECNRYTKAQLDYFGIMPYNDSPDRNGNTWCNDGTGSKVNTGTVTAYGYTIENIQGADCINKLLAKYPNQSIYDIVISFGKEREFGHVCYVHAIENGKVVFTDNWQVGGKEAFTALEIGLEDFIRYERNNGEIAALVHFYK